MDLARSLADDGEQATILAGGIALDDRCQLVGDDELVVNCWVTQLSTIFAKMTGRHVSVLATHTGDLDRGGPSR